MGSHSLLQGLVLTPETELMSPAVAGGSLPLSHQGSPESPLTSDVSFQ